MAGTRLTPEKITSPIQLMAAWFAMLILLVSVFLTLIVVPVLVGGGKRALPTGVRVNLELLDEGHFGDGTVYLRYGATT